MKKTLAALAVIAALNSSSAFAAPINDLGAGETAIGAGTTGYYLEHQLTDGFTLGYQNVDRDRYGDMNDIYGQFRVTNFFRAIIGHRSDLPYDDSNFYAGLAATVPLLPNVDGYASFVAGSDFDETQIGTNINLLSNVDFNINYHSFNPDYGRNEDGFGFGATVKF